MAIAHVGLFAVIAGVVGCSEVMIQPAEGGASSTGGAAPSDGGAAGDGGASSEGGAPGCDYGEFVDVAWVDPEDVAGTLPIGQCVGLPLAAAPDGHVSCVVIEARADLPAGCTGQNRAPARPELLAQVMANATFDPAWTSICELAQLSGAAHDECIGEVDSSTPGFCFVSNGAVAIGDPAMTEYCGPPWQLLKLSGDVVTPEVRAFFFCDDTPPPCP